MKRPIKIFVDRDETLKMRRADGEKAGGPGSIVATFDSSLSLYRVMDGDELRRIVRNRKILGGFFATRDERKYGASWGENISQVIHWGINQSRHGHLGKDLFLAKIGVYQKLFYHMNPGVNWDPNDPTQTFTMDATQCNTGLGCSVYDVHYSEAEFFRVNPKTEQITQLTDNEIRQYAEARPFKPVEIRSVTKGIYSHGTIHGIDIYAMLEQSDSAGAYRKTWTVRDRAERKIVIGARSEKIAIQKAAEALQFGIPAYPVDLLSKTKKMEWIREEERRRKWERMGMRTPRENPVPEIPTPALWVGAASLAALGIYLIAKAVQQQNQDNGYQYEPPITLNT